MEDINGYDVSADGKKILINKSNNYSIIDFGEDQKADKTLPLKDMEMTLNPQEEWNQIFNDSWRMMRDFFYDPGMHGVDWNAIRTQYASLLPYAINRSDVNFIIGDMIGELNASPPDPDHPLINIAIDPKCATGGHCQLAPSRTSQ